MRVPDAGQVLVETAIVLPLFVCVVLGILQLALLEQARLLAGYAAFQAVRAGIVWHGDPRRMEDAASWVLGPTVPGGTPKAALKTGSDFPGLRVDILHPFWPTDERYFRVAGGEEMDFDERPQEPDGGEGYRRATLLTVRLLYWYELKIPLADSMVWTAWLAQAVGAHLAGSLQAPLVAQGTGRTSVLAQGDGSERLLLGGKLSLENPLQDRDPDRGVYPTVPTRALSAMVASAATGHFFIPLVVQRTMRMQSNFFARHVRDCQCQSGNGCTDTCRAW